MNLRERYNSLSKTKKILLIVGACTVFGIASPTSELQNTQAPTDQSQSQQDTQEINLTEETPLNTVETKTEEITETVSYEVIEQNDATLESGTTKTKTEGQDGERTIVYEVTYENGIEAERAEVSNTVTTPPTNKIILIGTKIAQTTPVAAPAPQPSASCDPNYTGCVPIASDVDCAGGSGNGPAYVRGPVTVIGTDIYGLDRDKDGIGCE